MESELAKLIPLLQSSRNPEQVVMGLLENMVKDIEEALYYHHCYSCCKHAKETEVMPASTIK